MDEQEAKQLGIISLHVANESLVSYLLKYTISHSLLASKELEQQVYFLRSLFKEVVKLF